MARAADRTLRAEVQNRSKPLWFRLQRGLNSQNYLAIIRVNRDRHEFLNTR
jgi:hypothetical protein